MSKSSLPKLLPAEQVNVHSSIDPARYSKHAPILLISCVDYRFSHEIVDFMDKRGAFGKYDHVIIAGSSIGIDNTVYSELKAAFLTEMRILKELHNFEMVIILDHRDCGVYKMIHGNEHVHNMEQETDLHRDHLHNARNMILLEYPDVKVELLLMSMDGHVETIK